MREREIQGVIIATPQNLRYLTGFTGEEGYLLVDEQESSLLVDGRYATQALEETHACQPVLLEHGTKGVAAFLSSRNLQRVGVEAEGFSAAVFHQLRESTPESEMVLLTDELSRLRGIKTAEEIAWIREAVDIAERAWKEVVAKVAVGVSEHSLALELEFEMRRRGSEGVAFDIIVASGSRTSLPHARPTDRTLEAGDFITFDFGARWQGYCSDETCTVSLGAPSPRQRDIYTIVREAHDRAIDRVKPGVPLSDIDAAAREHIVSRGFGDRFSHGTGHGVGLAVHEWPVVGNESKEIAEEGMVFTIEPGIYLPGWGGVRIEDMVRVTGGGYEVLTTISKGMMILGA